MNEPAELVPQTSIEPTPTLAAGTEVPQRAKARAWGPWSSLGWSLLVFFGYSIVQGVVASAATLLDRSFRFTPEVPISGLGLALGTLAGAMFGVGLVFLLAYTRGRAPRDYLALRWPPGRAVALCVALQLVLVAVIDGLTYVVGKPIVADFMVNVYQSARSVWLLALGLMVGAPLFEETFFRGFLFRGLAESRLGRTGAIVLTAILFALPHVQYDAFGMATILVGGLFLGVVRDRTGSVLLTMLLHAVQNGVALIETVVAVGTWPG
jgi:membrane protease YdiL (CAAX protease family)